MFSVSVHLFPHTPERVCGGDEEDRTPDPLRARQMLSQLSYTPRSLSEDPYGTFKIKQHSTP